MRSQLGGARTEPPGLLAWLAGWQQLAVAGLAAAGCGWVGCQAKPGQSTAPNAAAQLLATSSGTEQARQQLPSVVLLSTAHPPAAPHVPVLTYGY